MNNTFRNLLILAFLAGFAATPVAAESAKVPAEKMALTVTIAIPAHNKQRSLNESDRFHVLVTNVSGTPKRLWTERYSWGYSNLSFELIGKGGTVVKIAKKPTGWDKNFPDWFELGPGETFVLDVNWFGDNVIWDNVPSRGKGSKAKLIKLRAVYQSAADEESTKLGVWTGKIESTLGTYAIW